MALVIETLGNGVNINGIVQSTGNWVVEEDGKGGVNINNKDGDIVYKGPLSDVSVNGVTFSNYTDFITAVSTVLFKSGGSGPGTEVSWDDVTDKPTQFTPSAHTHLAADITDLGTAATTDSADYATAAQGALASSAVQPATLDSRLSAAQRSAIDALVSPEEDYADMAEATVAIKAIIDALQAT